MGRGVGSLAYLFLGWRRPLNSVARNIVRGRRGRGQLAAGRLENRYGFYAGRDRNASPGRLHRDEMHQSPRCNRSCVMSCGIRNRTGRGRPSDALRRYRRVSTRPPTAVPRRRCPMAHALPAARRPRGARPRAPPGWAWGSSSAATRRDTDTGTTEDVTRDATDAIAGFHTSIIYVETP